MTCLILTNLSKFLKDKITQSHYPFQPKDAISFSMYNLDQNRPNLLNLVRTKRKKKRILFMSKTLLSLKFILIWHNISFVL